MSQNLFKNNLKIVFDNKAKYLLTNELNLQRGPSAIGALQVDLSMLCRSL